MKKALLLSAICASAVVSCGGGSSINLPPLQPIEIAIFGKFPALVAFQVGTNPWTDVTGLVNSNPSSMVHQYTHILTQNQAYGVMVVCKDPRGYFRGYIVQSTAGELKNLRFMCPPEPYTVQGQVLNLNPNSTASVFWKRRSHVNISNGSSYEIKTYFESGNLIAIEYDSNGTPTRIYEQQLTLSATHNINFNSASPANPINFTFTCNDPEYAGVSISWYKDGTFVNLVNPLTSASQAVTNVISPEPGYGLYSFDYRKDEYVAGVEEWDDLYSRGCWVKPNYYTGTVGVSFGGPLNRAAFEWEAWNHGVQYAREMHYDFYIRTKDRHSWNITLTKGWFKPTGNITGNVHQYKFPDVANLFTQRSIPLEAIPSENFMEHASINPVAYTDSWSSYEKCLRYELCPGVVLWSRLDIKW